MPVSPGPASRNNLSEHSTCLHEHQQFFFFYSRDWRIVHAIPRWLPACINTPAEAKALPHE